MTRIPTFLVVTAAAAACASAGGPHATAASLPPCALDAAPAGWHQVSTEGVTFCVPADWSSAGSESWRGDGGRVRWGWGQKTRQIASRVVAVSADRRPASRPVGGPPATSIQSRETLGGAVVSLTITREEENYRTGADWVTGTAFYMTGEAWSMAAAEEQLAVYRTARLVAR